MCPRVPLLQRRKAWASGVPTLPRNGHQNKEIKTKLYFASTFLSPPSVLALASAIGKKVYKIQMTVKSQQLIRQQCTPSHSSLD